MSDTPINLDQLLDRAAVTFINNGWWTSAVWLLCHRLERAGQVAQPWFLLGGVAMLRARAIRDVQLLRLAAGCLARAHEIQPSHMEAATMVQVMRSGPLTSEVGPFRGRPGEIAEHVGVTYEDFRGGLVDIESASARRELRAALLPQEEWDLSGMVIIDALDHERDPENLIQVLNAASDWNSSAIDEAIRKLPERIDVATLQPAYGEALEALESSASDEDE